jgi:hypothetical protein
VATKRHKSAVVAQSSNTNLSTFFKSIVPDKNDKAIALQEGTFAFHTVQHHQIHGLFFRFDKKIL